jgi:hypothetical protein
MSSDGVNYWLLHLRTKLNNNEFDGGKALFFSPNHADPKEGVLWPIVIKRENFQSVVSDFVLTWDSNYRLALMVF